MVRKPYGPPRTSAPLQGLEPGGGALEIGTKNSKLLVLNSPGVSFCSSSADRNNPAQFITFLEHRVTRPGRQHLIPDVFPGRCRRESITGKLPFFRLIDSRPLLSYLSAVPLVSCAVGILHARAVLP